MQSDFVLVILHLSTVVNKAIVNKKLFALFKNKPVSFDYMLFSPGKITAAPLHIFKNVPVSHKSFHINCQLLSIFSSILVKKKK